MFYGLCDLPWWGNLLVLLVFTQVTIIGVTVYLHRCQAHRALNMHPIASHFFRLWMWLSTGMITKEWAAVHRKHHAKCETNEDPHSPQVFGLTKVLWEGAELYRKETANAETLERYGQGTPDDWIERNLYTKHSKLGVVIMLLLDVMLFGVPGITIWALQMIWIPFFAAGVVNGVGHYWGYRNFECPDQARNVFPWGIFIGGEELHNNHHTYPTSAKLSVKWWEVDMGWFYIRLLELVGLAKAKRRPPEPALIPGKTHIDVETLKAIILNRFHVMAHYSREVIVPILHQEKQKIQQEGKDMWKRAKSVLIRETSLLDTAAKQKLAYFLTHYNSMHVVYDFKERLQNIWAQSSLKEKELLEALQKWCHEAEATGIKALKEFSNYLKSFSLA